jgi:hypothetical protein
MSQDTDQMELLEQARQRARKVLDDLVRQRDELLAHPPDLAPAQLEAGRLAMARAVDAARRMLHSIEQALAIARGFLN